MNTTLKWILIIGLGLLAVWYFFIRKKPATSNTTTDTSKTTYTQVPPIDKNGCDSTGKDKDGKPCTYQPPVLVITNAVHKTASGSTSSNVTAKLQSLVNNGAIKVDAVAGQNTLVNLFGVDLDPKQKKLLLVAYTLDGVAGSKTFNDTDSIIIP